MNDAFIQELLKQADDMTIAHAVRVLDESVIASMARLFYGLSPVVEDVPKPAAKAKKTGAKTAAPALGDAEVLHAVLSALRTAKENLTAGSIQSITSIDGAIVSKALKRLEKAGNITSTGTRRGKRYSLVASNGAAEATAP